MAETLQIFSQNCQGLGNVQKRRSLFKHLRSKKYNIICLQDVHLQNEMEKYIKAEWGYNIFMSSFSRNSRGVMVLMNNNFEHKVERVKIDPNGNFVILDLNIEGKNITLVNLYGPNEDKPQFYNNLKQKYQEFSNEYVIICGDWNLVLDPDIDTNNYLHINNPRARLEVLKLLNEDNFIDVWRVMHDNEKGFTWSRKNPVRKQARLDFFLVNENCFPYVYETSIISGFRTDHSSILLKVRLHDNERGRGYWKFNNSLLKDKKYIQLVKETINEVKETYVHNENSQNHNNINVSDENIIFEINDQLFLETLLLIIRGNTIKFSSIKKRKSQEEEKKLENEIKLIEEEINSNFLTTTEERLQELEQKKNNLTEIRNDKIDGVMLRSRSRYEELGEKPTKYFFSIRKS